MPPEVYQRLRHRAMSFKVCTHREFGEQHVLLLFEDLATAYHVRSVEELDRIIDALINIREDALSGRIGG